MCSCVNSCASAVMMVNSSIQPYATKFENAKRLPLDLFLLFCCCYFSFIMAQSWTQDALEESLYHLELPMSCKRICYLDIMDIKIENIFKISSKIEAKCSTVGGKALKCMH